MAPLNARKHKSEIQTGSCDANGEMKKHAAAFSYTQKYWRLDHPLGRAVITSGYTANYKAKLDYYTGRHVTRQINNHV